MVSLLSNDCHFESLALHETFKGPQVKAHFLLLATPATVCKQA